MDFTTIGSVTSYMKSMKLQTKWNQKKSTGDFSKDECKSSLQRKNEMFKKSYMEQQKNNESDKTLTSIHAKIAAGTKLTTEEMRYLQVKDPTSYQKVKRLEMEKKQYEEDLKRCKTKNDVEKLKMTKVSSALSSINSVKNNPNIPDATKLAVCEEELHKLSEFEKIELKFKQSSQYQDLPTEAEKNKAEKEIREAEEAERKEILQNQNKEYVQKSDENQDEQELDNTKTADSEKVDNTVADAKSEPESDNNIKEAKSKIEAEQTPEAKKLKRAKAKSGYKSVRDYFKNSAPVSFISIGEKK